MPNLYFTRDPFVVIGNGVSVNKVYLKTRCRETIYGKYIFKYHPVYKTNNLFYDREYRYSIEGGDILVLSDKVIIIGISQRTEPTAIEKIAKRLFYTYKTNYNTILAFTIPKRRTFMHLDTIFTQVDFDKFTIHSEYYKNLKIFKIDKSFNEKIVISEEKDPLETVLGKYVGHRVTLIPCVEAEYQL